LLNIFFISHNNNKNLHNRARIKLITFKTVEIIWILT